MRDAERLGSTAFAALPLAAGRASHRPVGLLWVALPPPQSVAGHMHSLIPCCSLLQTLPSGKSLTQQKQQASHTQLVTAVGQGLEPSGASAGPTYLPKPNTAEQLLRDRLALRKLAGAVSLALATSSPAPSSPGPYSSASDRVRQQDDPLSWRAGVGARLWSAGGLQDLVEAVRQAAAQHVSRSCLAEVAVTVAVAPSAAAKVGYMLRAEAAGPAAVAAAARPSSSLLPLPLFDERNSGRESPTPPDYAGPSRRPATL